MTNRDEVLKSALDAHKEGRLAEAEAGYRSVLRHRPSHPYALYSLGLLHFHRGEIESALQCARSAAEQAPANGRIWNTLGSMLIAARRTDEARDAYRRATEVDPAMAEAWYNLGICLRNEGDYEAAVRCLREALARPPPFGGAYEALAMLLYELGRPQEAAEIGALWLARDPSSAKARHVAASMSGENVPARASDDYVREHFDAAAAGFDANLGQLEYRAPGLIAAALARGAAGAQSDASPRLLASVLDAGCGTGLCGPLIRPYAGRLAGVDLSPKMVERANARGVYDELHVAELCAFLRASEDTFDAIVSADTLVYFGALDETLQAARGALHASGVLVFTLESLSPDENNVDHRLQFHGRYAHSESYVRRVLQETGFALEALSRETLRQERLEAVNGFLVTARRSPALR
jgi:predicted TPR repeat methyltransferase